MSFENRFSRILGEEAEMPASFSYVDAFAKDRGKYKIFFNGELAMLCVMAKAGDPGVLVCYVIDKSNESKDKANLFLFHGKVEIFEYESCDKKYQSPPIFDPGKFIEAHPEESQDEQEPNYFGPL